LWYIYFSDVRDLNNYCNFFGILCHCNWEW
jgi:hypothetical protein